MQNPEQNFPQPLSNEEAAAQAAEILRSTSVGAGILDAINDAEAGGQLDSVPERDVDNEAKVLEAQAKSDPLELLFNAPAYEENPKDDSEQ